MDRIEPSQTEVHIGPRTVTGGRSGSRCPRDFGLPGYELLASPVDPGDVSLSSARNDVAIVLLDRPGTGGGPAAFGGTTQVSSAPITVPDAQPSA